MFKDLPIWFAIINGIALGIGYTVLLYCLCKAMRPTLRGLSYGLYETIVYYKGGADLGRVFTRFLRALCFDLFVWGLLNPHTESITNNMTGWYGIFSWRFKPEFNRAASKRYNAEARNKPAHETETVPDDDDFGSELDK